MTVSEHLANNSLLFVHRMLHWLVPSTNKQNYTTHSLILSLWPWLALAIHTAVLNSQVMAGKIHQGTRNRKISSPDFSFKLCASSANFWRRTCPSNRQLLRGSCSISTPHKPAPDAPAPALVALPESQRRTKSAAVLGKKGNNQWDFKTRLEISNLENKSLKSVTQACK